MLLCERYFGVRRTHILPTQKIYVADGKICEASPKV